MKKIMMFTMLMMSLGLSAQEKLKNETVMFEFELDQTTHTINLEELLAFPGPTDPPIDAPTCFGDAPLCSLLVMMWEMGRTDIPSGCHRSGAVGSDVYYCEIR